MTHVDSFSEPPMIDLFPQDRHRWPQSEPRPQQLLTPRSFMRQLRTYRPYIDPPLIELPKVSEELQQLRWPRTENGEHWCFMGLLGPVQFWFVKAFIYLAFWWILLVILP